MDKSAQANDKKKRKRDRLSDLTRTILEARKKEVEGDSNKSESRYFNQT